MYPDLHLDDILQHRRQIGIAAAGAAAAIGILWYVVVSRRPTPDEVERRRRLRLAAMGRIIDGVITDFVSPEESLAETSAETSEAQPEPAASSTQPRILFYQYVIAGVTYQCAQEVSSLSNHIANFRIDAPVQVKYDPRNPTNSIILSETWSGLYAHAARPARATV